MADDEKASDRVSVEVLYDQENRQIFHVNFGKFSHIGSEVFLDIGVLDDQRLLLLRKGLLKDEEGNEPKTVPAYITHRFAMSAEGFSSFKTNVEDIWEKLKAAGLVKEKSASSNPQDD